MRVLILNQSFYPDVVSTAQHASDFAVHLARRGHDVTVLCSRRAYDSPERVFAARETWKGVRIVRIPSLGLGKASKARRALDFASFFASATLALAGLPRFDAVVAMTSPPLISALASAFVRVKGGALSLWMMDLNPDEAIAAGWLREGTPVARMLQHALLFGLRRADSVVVLDRFMRERVVGKGYPEGRVHVIPPWPHDSVVRYDAAGREKFRGLHGLETRFVVMYSGNHSPCHPLDTLLRTAEALAHRDDIAFCFVGGGSEHAKVRRFAAERRLRNILCLPYQPLDTLSASLSAADLHAVVMGEPFVGIVHPCKIYNVLTLGTPLLYIGPRPSHVTDLLPAIPGEHAYVCSHGDVDGTASSVLTAASRDRRCASPGAPPGFSEAELLAKMTHALESAVGARNRRFHVPAFEPDRP